MAGKYVPENLIITIVGNAKEVAKGLEKYGEVKYFDRDGNPVEAPTTKAVDGNLKGEDILKKALAAYGGEQAMNSVQDMTMTGTMGLMGQSFAMERK
jgi:hypothetical protein